MQEKIREYWYVEYFTIERGIWAEEHKDYFRAYDIEDLLQEISKYRQKQFYLLRIWKQEKDGYVLQMNKKVV